MKPHRVPRSVGLNPVAQAVFRARFSGQMMDTQIRVLMLDQDEACMDLIQDASFVLAVIGLGCEMQGLGDHRTNILRGGLSALAQMATAGLWDKAQAVGVHAALVHATDLLPEIKPVNVSKAAQRVHTIEVFEKYKARKIED